jgi:hypothetical protein
VSAPAKNNLRAGPAVLAGAALLLFGLGLAWLISAALYTAIGAVTRGSDTGQYLQLLALPVYALLATFWIIHVVSQLGIRSGRPLVGVGSYALLGALAAVLWFSRGNSWRALAPLASTLAAGIVPLLLGVQTAHARLKPPPAEDPT